MYKMRAGVKQDPVRRWALADRIFFSNGACHILAGVFLRSPPLHGFYAERVIPGDDFAGNHIYVTDGKVAFDYRGYSSRVKMLVYHTNGWSRRSSEGWNCIVERVDFDLLSTSELNRRKMLGPDQYQVGDPVPRAQRFLERIAHHRAIAKAMLTAGSLCPGSQL